jgi:hypothetical protein
MASETDIAARYIYSKLTASSAITAIVGSRIFEGVAPQGTTAPWIVYSSLAPTDTYAIGAIRIMTRDQWLVRAVAQTASFGGDIGTLADAIEAALHGTDGTSGAVTGGYTVECYRLMPHRLLQVDNGVQWRYKGGIYRISTQLT